MMEIGIALICLGSALLLAALVLIVGGYITYRMAFYNNVSKKPVDPYKFAKGDDPVSNLSRELIGKILEMEFEDVYVTSHDGLKLHARLRITDEGAPLVICAHGYKSFYAIDFSGGAPDLIDSGMNVLIIDERACGESEGKTVSFGYYEKKDINTWVKYVEERFGKDVKIILCGVSMGAATVIMAASEELSPSVVGVFADCPYGSAKEIIKKVIRDMRLPAGFLYPLVRFGAILYGGFDPNKAEPRASSDKIEVPTVIVHGEADGFVPAFMSRDIATKNEKHIKYYTFPDATHGMSYLYDRERYRAIVREHTVESLGEKIAK